MDAFFLKKLAGAALMPVSLAMLLIAVGLLAAAVKRSRRAGLWLTASGFSALVLLSYGIPFHRLAGSLEARHPGLVTIEPSARVAWIVVLGGGARAGEHLPLSSRLSEDALYRVVEAVRLHRLAPGSRLLFSGGAAFGGVAPADLAARLAQSLGVQPEAIVVERKARDTAEEALYIQEAVGAERFVLVTSAMHMPRAVMHFNARGLHPLPAPTQHRIAPAVGFHPAHLFPSPVNLAIANAAAHEYLGMWAAKVRARGVGVAE